MSKKTEDEPSDPEEEEKESVPELFPPEGSLGGVGSPPYFGAGPVFFEPQFLCHWCGEKKGVGELIGKCVKCNKMLCDECVQYKGRRIYCPDHAPRCFIATAAYQSEEAPEVRSLREFRDKILLRNLLGAGMVDFYYTVSPAIAAMIEKNSGLQQAFRRLLRPAVEFGRLSSRSK
jgi:hypothetical protein